MALGLRLSQARPSFPNVSRAFRPPPDIGQSMGSPFFSSRAPFRLRGCADQLDARETASGAGAIRREEGEDRRRSICPVNCTRRVACRNAAAVLREGSGKSARDSRALSPSFRQRRAPPARHYREMFANTVRLIKKCTTSLQTRRLKYMVASVQSRYFHSYPDALGGEVYLSRHFYFRSQLYRRSAAEWEVYLQFCNSSKKKRWEKNIICYALNWSLVSFFAKLSEYKNLYTR